MNIPDVILENLVSVFWVKNTYKFLMRIRDLGNPGSGMEKIRTGILDPG
jgi:hypothetical protein